MPKYKKKKIEKLKICQEPGCGKEYYGNPISKYCELHTDPHNRIRKRKLVQDSNMANMRFDHNYIDTVDVEFNCSLPGCDKKYSVKVYPGIFVYSKYCEEHRNEFKRKQFLREHKKNLDDILDEVKP